MSSFFTERNIAGTVYLDMLQNFLMPQFDLGEVRRCEYAFPSQCVGQASRYTATSTPPPPDLTPLDIFVCWSVRAKVYFPHLPADVDLQARTTGTVADVTLDMLRRTWKEIHYSWDICRAASASHIEL